MRRLIPCLFVLAFLSGCVNDMPSSELGSRNATQKILIASQDTKFKRKVLNGVVEKLGEEDWHYRIIGLSNLAGQDPGKYGAILIMSPIEGGIIDKRVGAFFKKDPANPKAIVIYTYGLQSLKDKIRRDFQVDAVSSASVDSLAPTLSD